MYNLITKKEIVLNFKIGCPVEMKSKATPFLFVEFRYNNFPDRKKMHG